MGQPSAVHAGGCNSQRMWARGTTCWLAGPHPCLATTASPAPLLVLAHAPPPFATACHACRLVAAAPVPKTGYFLADLILWLPTAATAQLPVRLEFLTAEQAVGASSDGSQAGGAGEAEGLAAASVLGAGVAQQAASVVPAPSGLRQAPAVNAPAVVDSKVG